MADATVQKVPAPDQIDPIEHTLQANALLCVLLRNFGGEVAGEDRPADGDIYRTIFAAERLVSACVRDQEILESALPHDAFPLLDEAGSILRVLLAGSFIPAESSVGGVVTQAHADDIVENAIWAASANVSKARAMLGV